METIKERIIDVIGQKKLTLIFCLPEFFPPVGIVSLLGGLVILIQSMIVDSLFKLMIAVILICFSYLIFDANTKFYDLIEFIKESKEEK